MSDVVDGMSKLGCVNEARVELASVSIVSCEVEFVACRDSGLPVSGRFVRDVFVVGRELYTYMSAASNQFIHDYICLRFKAWRLPKFVVARSKEGDSAAVFQNSGKLLRGLNQELWEDFPRCPNVIDCIIASCYQDNLVLEFELAFCYQLSVAASFLMGFFTILYNVLRDHVDEGLASGTNFDAKKNIVKTFSQVLASVPFNEAFALLLGVFPIISKTTYRVHVDKELD
jgi:hypothetical protein